ncbi:MAG: DUF5666 domain-containing protein [Anaerolineae bacterium]|nr:DUF5666 domain-containing protein [Anaerolineae bacterium]
MNSLDNLLEERLARLEGGEPLEVCLADLPEDEALLLKKAAMLRTMASTTSVSNKFAEQRRELLQLASQKNRTPSVASTAVSKTRTRWVFPVALAGGAFAVFTCFIVFSLLAGLTGLRWLNQPYLNQPQGIALEAPDPQSAVLEDARGLVEVQDSNGAWNVTRIGQTVQAGQRIRTGRLSSVTLGFYDGSKTSLGPSSELSLDEVDAQKSGARVVVLTQWLGESKHDVAQSSDPASRYEVHTPSGVGTAKGTSFRVFVTVALLVRFDVDEGAVSVTSLDTTVLVVAGQSTVITSGGIPSQPVFRIKGEGTLEKTGSTWRIAGRTFRTDSDTVFIGNPQVGDLVAFEALIVTDGSPILDRVELLVQSPEDRFAFTGTVDVIGDAEWTIGGRTVQVDEMTEIDEEIQVGNIVKVKGNILEDGKLQATHIDLIEEDEEGLPFQFVGVVDEIAETEWAISGISVEVNEDTNIETGIAVGDIVRVRGRILRDGTWLARSIQLAEEDERRFVITGTVDSRDPWMVSGVEFDTDERTEIDDGIELGSRVRVEGRILNDGQWMAEEIELLEEDIEPRRFSFTGVVNSIDPWNVGGVDFTIDEHTVIVGQVLVGDLVHVKGVILPDGTWLAEKIKLIDIDNDDLGCFSFSTAVREAHVNQIVLLDWSVVQLGQGIEVEGEINIATVIIVSGCTQSNGFSITHIIVIYQLESLPVIIKPPSNGGGGDGGDSDDDDDDGGDG